MLLLAIVSLVVFILGVALGHSQAWHHSQKTIQIIRAANTADVKKHRASYYNQGWDDCKKVNYRERLATDGPKSLEERVDAFKQKLDIPQGYLLSDWIDPTSRSNTDNARDF